ncbi:DUF3304 domain-containing protein [Trinickia sp. YCB016]
MKKQNYRMQFVAVGLVFAGMLSGCQTLGKEQTFGSTLTGIDHLANQLSVSDFSVNGTGGFQAGTGASFVCCVVLPDKWYPGLTAHVKWEVSDWRDHVNGGEFEADVPVDRYFEHGRVWVHFLPDGTVRVVVSNDGPYSPLYPGPHDPIPQKQPWKDYPKPGVSDDRPTFSREELKKYNLLPPEKDHE